MSSSSSSSNPTVAQMLDVTPLDNYLLSLLLLPLEQTIFSRMLPNNNNHDNNNNNNSSGRQAAALFLRNHGKSWIQEVFFSILTLVVSQGQTPACQVLGLTRVVIDDDGKDARNKRLALYAVLAFVLPKCYQHVKDYWMTSVQDEPSSSLGHHHQNQHQQQLLILMRQRRKAVVERLFQTLDTILPLLKLGCLLQCWRTGTTKGKHTAPSSGPDLSMRLSGLAFQKTSSNDDTTTNIGNRSVPLLSLHVLYAHRRWIQHEAQRLIPLLVVPVLSCMKESKDWMFQLGHQLLEQPVVRNLAILILQQQRRRRQQCDCPICHTKVPNIRVAYETNCHHLYCYTCLWQHVISHQQSSSFAPRCRVCQTPITSCQPALGLRVVPSTSS